MKMSKGVFKKWALENRERLVLRFQLEQVPGAKLVELAEDRGHTVTPKSSRQELVEAIMGDLWVELPEGYNRRKVCRTLGVPLELKARRIGDQGKPQLLQVPAALV